MPLRPASRNGVEGVVLENDQLALSIFPAAGGKILDLIHRPTGENLLWQNPRVGLAPTHAGAPFDDVWCGGWDEVFPTDPPCADDDNHYHDHGDLWIGPWALEADGDSSLVLDRASASLPVTMRKRIELRGDEPELRVHYTLSNVGHAAVAFMWDIHIAHAVRAGSRIHLDARSLDAEPPFLGRLEGAARPFSWPMTGGADLSVVPPAAAALTEFLCADGLPGGACAVTHPDIGLGVALAFSTAVFPYLWLFGVYGGWRGHHVLLTEPCTSRPGSLLQNVAAGTAATLPAGASLETELAVRILLPGQLDMANAIAFD